MRKEVPTQVSKEELTFPVSEIEPLLSGPATELPEYEPTMIKLKNGKTMVIRPLLKEEAPAMINYLKKFIDVNKDFYDIVGVRVCGEILGWLRNRLKDSYQLVGVIDGELAGFANARLMNDDIYISLHSMAYQRGGRVGAAMYYAKAKFAFDVLGAEEWWSTFESYNGWMRWGLGMAQPSYPWPEVQHELGGARVYYIRKDYWESTVKNYIQQVVGSDLESNVPKDLLDQAYDMKIPESPNI
jgi:hypothetical protein